MKAKLSFVPILVTLFLMACGGSEQTKKEEQPEVAAPVVVQKFIIKAFNSQYIALTPDSTLVPNQPDPTKAEAFEKIDLGGGKYALKASSGKYVVADRHRDNFLYANSNNAWEWETFEIIAIDNYNVVIKSSNGKFVSSDHKVGDFLIANRDEANLWETFQFEEK